MTWTGDMLYVKRVPGKEADGSETAPPTVERTHMPSLVEAPPVSHDWEAMESRILELEQRVYNLTQLVDDTGATAEEVVVLREIPREQAKQEIAALFSGDEVLDYGDIADRLGLDLGLVVDICNELEEEGVIGEYAEG
jgi:hypothetical protein